MVSRVKLSVATARGVAERWRTQYQRDDRWTKTAMSDSEETYNTLCALGPNPDIEKVSEAIGNKSWSHLSCGSCGDYAVRTLDFGSEHSDYGIVLCEPCLRDGLSAITNGENK